MKPQILEYLRQHPKGAFTDEIARAVVHRNDPMWKVFGRLPTCGPTRRTQSVIVVAHVLNGLRRKGIVTGEKHWIPDDKKVLTLWRVL